MPGWYGPGVLPQRLVLTFFHHSSEGKLMTSEIFHLVAGKSNLPLRRSYQPSLTRKIDRQFIKKILQGLSWWVPFAVGLTLVLFEIAEYLNSQGKVLHIYHIVVSLAGLLFLLFMFLYNVISNKNNDLAAQNENASEKKIFPIHLSDTQNIPELARDILTTLPTIYPSAHGRLFLYHQERFELAANSPEYASLHLTGEIKPALPDQRSAMVSSQAVPELTMEMCQNCFTNSSHAVQFNACKLHHIRKMSAGDNGYCLPLSHGSTPVGLLHVHLPLDSDFSAHQRNLFHSLGKETGAILGNALEREKHDQIIRAQVTSTIQEDLARNLHDTIGQNISFLRMKLEYLSETGFQGKIDPEKEIKALYGVANDSYDQVRGILAILQSGGDGCLEDLLAKHAASVAERSGMQINLVNSGKPQALPTQTLNHLFFIFREALWNIEKYASATSVKVEIAWSKTELRLNISDDGCGFDLSAYSADQHYGLKFMRERAKKMNGTFAIKSAAGKGTSLLFQIPILPENLV